MKFTEFGFVSEIQKAVDQMGFSECTPIQEATISHVLEGRDIAGLAQTGTGKTAAFLLPLMDRIVRSRKAQESVATGVEQTDGESENSKRLFSHWKSHHFILILVPTRELAEQVYDNVYKLRGDSQIEAVSIIGGVAYDTQKSAIRRGVDFIVATPGRLIDLYKDHQVDLRQVRAVVFDEADRMFDMGFKDDMKFILRRIPKERQFLVFSATLNFDVLNVAYQFGANPIECNVSRDQAKAENVKDEIFHIGNGEKPSYLLSILKRHNPKQAIIFSNFKNNVNRLAQFLVDNGFAALGISSLLNQNQRIRVMTQFRDGDQCHILVATDVAARGLDIKGVDLVVNYELPDDPESYVHRIGRTGRAGEEGFAVSLVSDQSVEALERIESYLKHKLAIGWLEDEAIIKEFKPLREFERSTGYPVRTKDVGAARDRGGSFEKKKGGRKRPRRERPPSDKNGVMKDRPHQQSSGAKGAERGDPKNPRRGDLRNQGSEQKSTQSERGSSQWSAKRGRDQHKQRRDSNSRPHPHGNSSNRHRTDFKRERPSTQGTPRPHSPSVSAAVPGNSKPTLAQKTARFFKKLFGADSV